jgi:signal transduction histidine kinase/ActR/RegA family two-component response regulator
MKNFLAVFLIFFSVQLGYSQQDSLKKTSNSKLIELIEKTIDSSTSYYDEGIYAKSLILNIELLDLAKQTKDPSYLNKAYRFLAYDFMAINDTLLAKKNFENAKKYAEILNDDLTIGLSFMDLANYHSVTDLDYDKAIQYHDLSIYSIEKSKDSTELIKAYYNAAITALYEEEFEKSKDYLDALSAHSFAKYKPELFFASEKCLWALYYNENKQFLKAETYSRESIKVANSLELIGEKADALEQLAISLNGQKKYKEAYETSLEFKDFSDETKILIQDAQSKAALAKLKIDEYRYEIEYQKEKTNFQVQIAENKNFINNILIIVCLSGLLFFIVLLAAYLKRKDLNLALLKKNEGYLKEKEKSELLAKAKSNFFSTVSHELRTPLYGVIGLSTILLDDPKLKSHEQDLKSLKFSADYLLALINDVLQINKIDSKNLDNDESLFNVRDFIQSITATFEYMRLQNKNKIIVEIGPEIPHYLKGNVIRLSQILMNLVGNALKFTENGIITISLFLEEEKITKNYSILFSIADTGIGIPKEKQEIIFDEFTQVEPLNYTYQGTGLGLPIVKKLLHASNSKIILESDLGKGTTIKFSLSFQEVTEEIKKEPTTLLNKTLLKGKQILIAEDNRINQIVTKKILEKKGVICTIAENGKEALALSKQQSYDLILMDLNMPLMDGYQATIAIRKFNTEIPIIALTAVEIEEVRNEIYITGMDDIIVKPYDDNKFTRIILENLSKNRNSKSNQKAIH